jgi:NAD(P)H-hydrate repair Nnr-like enzyme with NAD(P)H-hydrate dehydratase domain
VIGGAPGMAGAALLAGSAALHAGAGRVFVGLLDPSAAAVDPAQPELMLRDAHALDLSGMTAVCGCGGGAAVRDGAAARDGDIGSAWCSMPMRSMPSPPTARCRRNWHREESADCPT